MVEITAIGTLRFPGHLNAIYVPSRFAAIMVDGLVNLLLRERAFEDFKFKTSLKNVALCQVTQDQINTCSIYA